jgi:hypothetical protein
MACLRIYSRLVLAFIALFSALTARAATPILQDNLDRPLRYMPEGTDFVITNGAEFFNRPLYTNTAFRVDGGDKPEFSLYLPGRGGNVRLGILTASGGKWLNDAAQVVTRYRPGSLVYEVSDPLLGEQGKLNLTAMVLPTGQGLILRVDTVNVPAVTLVWAYGGANGVEGKRGGDIGTESQPVSRFFQFDPANCSGDAFSINGRSFTLQFRANGARTGVTTNILGVAPPDTKLAVADASQWDSLMGLLATANAPATAPVLTGQTPLAADSSVYLALQRIPQPGENTSAELPTYVEAGGAPPADTAATPASPTTSLTYADLPQTFDAAEARRKSIAERVTADTPDPYINAAMAALCVAADGIWDESSGVFEHGAVAWRSRLEGWRGAYSGDALGWFDREVRHLTYWAGRQNTKTITQPPPPDAASHYSRDEAALHTNGDMSNSHYDMNMISMDEVMRHLLWTGDLDFARQEWPVIQRYLAWEQRLFRRPFDGGLPLYEGYAAIWASDDLEYGGGGATHSSAFNYFHNLMAARLAQLLGEDAAPYQREAELIRQGMRTNLWLADRGWYAEYKDLLGLQRTHPAAALWTFYHAIDEQAATPLEAWQMTRYVDTQIAHIPIRGPGVPEGYYALATSNWMPYTWSLNNVVMGESAHTALAYWEANRDDEAYKILKGCLLDSMYLGLCPGDVGTMTYYDAYRGESQRDFGDDIGALSRAMVEGLFGVHPDALAGELVLRPGLPAAWDHASFHHPSLDYTYHADGPVQIPHTTERSVDTGDARGTVIMQRETTSTPGFAETYSVTLRFPKPLALRLQAVARRSDIASVTVNGQPSTWKALDDSVGTPRIEIACPPAEHYDINIVWMGGALAAPAAPAVVVAGRDMVVPVGLARVREINDPQGAINNFGATASTVTATAVGAPGFHTAFLKIQQGALTWTAPLTFGIRPAFELVPAETHEPGQLTFSVRNNNSAAFAGNVAIQSQGGEESKMALAIPALGTSAPINLAPALPGSNRVVADLGGGQTVEGIVTNWKLAADSAKVHFEPVDLTASFNDRVTQIFKNQYLTPRSPYPSLSIPLQGFGTWTNFTVTFNVDDRGLRAAAAQGGGTFTLPDQGVPFRTPGDSSGKNILFTSQWDNYPRVAGVPLAGQASHIYLLMAGSTNPMQSRLDNGEIIVAYADGSLARLPLTNPTTWWPIDQDYFIDDYAFARPGPIPPRVDLATGLERTLDLREFKGRGGRVNGGAATVLDLPLDPSKQLQSLTLRTLSNDVVIGLLAVTLVR